MKSTGIVRKVDDLYRLVIPRELCKAYGISKKTPMEVYTEDDRIILRKYQPGCIICGSVDNTYIYRGKTVCTSCIPR